MNLIDTHCHLTSKEYNENIQSVLEKSIEANVKRWITIGTDSADSEKAVSLANRFENMYAAVGIHPHDAESATDSDLLKIKQLAADKKCVAIGETGLDFYYNLSDKKSQYKLFENMLETAIETDLPVMIHSRDAADDTLEIIDRFSERIKKLVFHCFSYTPRYAEKLLERGFYISFTGVVTFKNADQTREVAKIVPIDRMMIETDCPYMSPAPMRNQKTNEPALLQHTARCIAEVKNMDFSECAAAVTSTSNKFFNLSAI
jgi:TatD DNase family protein